MDGEDVEQALAGRSCSFWRELIEQPGQVVRAAVVVAIGQRAPAVQAARTAGRSRCRSSRSSPTPPGPTTSADGSTALIFAGVVDDLVLDLVHRRARRMDVAVRRVPDARLVVEDVVAQAAVRVRAPAADQCCTQPCWNVDVRRHVGVVRIVAGDDTGRWSARRCPRRGTTASRSRSARRTWRSRSSRACCGSAPSLATQSIVGIVSIACAFAGPRFAMNVSPRSPAVALLSAMLSKYQSLPRLSAFSCQL